MKVTKQHVVAVAGIIVGGLLLVCVASCSLEKQAAVDSEQKQVEEIAAETEAINGSDEKATFVANVFCSACHYGFDDEELAANHRKAGIGCERCHGESERHRNDENNITPPEIMYPKAKINPTCMMCHPRHQIEQVSAHEPLLAGAKTIFDADSDTDSDKLYCTTCHAKEHRINVRTVQWNKATGELLEK